jgi:hypothetical protein
VSKSASKTSHNEKRSIYGLLVRPVLFPCPVPTGHFYWHSSQVLAAAALIGSTAIDQELQPTRQQASRGMLQCGISSVKVVRNKPDSFFRPPFCFDIFALNSLASLERRSPNG